MADLLAAVDGDLRAAFAAVTGLPPTDIDPVVRPSERADAQANGALALAKQIGRNPRDLAAEVVAALPAGRATFDVAGPGFVNITFADEWIAAELNAVAGDERLGVPPAERPETVVVDYSAPNVAKEMHVGNLRSTVIGDCVVRLYEFLGHRVIKENHIGDWGTPFGMLIEHLLEEEAAGALMLDMSDPNPFYQAARAKFDGDDDFKRRARQRVVMLQQGEPVTRALWQQLVDASVSYFDRVYSDLGVLLTDDDLMGESAYDPLLPEVVDRLRVAGLLEISDGAGVVFPPGFKNRDGEPLPLIVQKRDGGFNYGTSDLACVLDRVERVKATLMLYVIGAPQALHLSMVFAVAEMAGWLAPPVRAVHVSFGSVLGTDRKMLRTRSGESVKLQDLITEAIERGTASVAERSPELSAEEQQRVGHMVGVGAVKYADLSTDRIKDYVFDWERMLAFEGNTGPYLQYAYARISSIFRRAGIEGHSGQIVIAEQQERALALRLLGFQPAVAETAERCAPHRLCAYLFDLAQDFTAFYEACPVLKADDLTRASRLALCALTARVLHRGLALLGIDAPERM